MGLHGGADGGRDLDNLHRRQQRHAVSAGLDALGRQPGPRQARVRLRHRSLHFAAGPFRQRSRRPSLPRRPCPCLLRSDDEQEDIEYLRFRDFVNILEGHTAEVHKQAGRLIRKEAKVLSVMKDLSDAAMGLAQFEKEPLKQCLGIAAARCTQLSSSLDSCVQEMDASLEAPLKESVRALREVRSTMEDRARALSNLSQAQGEVEVRRSRLTKLRSTPGVKQDRLIMAERELSVAQQTVEVQRGEYTAIVNKMGGELARCGAGAAWQMQRRRARLSWGISLSQLACPQLPARAVGGARAGHAQLCAHAAGHGARAGQGMGDGGGRAGSRSGPLPRGAQGRGWR